MSTNLASVMTNCRSKLRTMLLSCFCLVIGRHVIALDSNDQLRSVLNAIQQNKLLNPNTEEYQVVLTQLVRSAHLKLRVNINQEPRSEAINFYLLAEDASSRIDLPIVLLSQTGINVLNNCNYIGISNAIICSSDFINSFFKDHIEKDFLPDKWGGQKPAIQDGFVYEWDARRAFITWVLGHELGHLVHGDLDSHFGESAAFESTASVTELSQDKELKADLYCATQIAKHNRFQTKAIEQILITLTNEQVAGKGFTQGVGVGTLQGFYDKQMINYSVTGDHPEYVVRATRMLEILGKLTHDEALSSMSDSFARHLRSEP